VHLRSHLGVATATIDGAAVVTPCEVDRAGQSSIADRECGDGGLPRSRRAERMAVLSLSRAYRDASGSFAERGSIRVDFRGVAELRRRPVCALSASTSSGATRASPSAAAIARAVCEPSFKGSAMWCASFDVALNKITVHEVLYGNGESATSNAACTP
jgi:hypothetical protein